MESGVFSAGKRDGVRWLCWGEGSERRVRRFFFWDGLALVVGMEEGGVSQWMHGRVDGRMEGGRLGLAL